MNKTVAILGSTGSIGTQALEVIEGIEGFKVTALAADKNVALLEKQIQKFRPGFVAMKDGNAAVELKKRIRGTEWDVPVEAGMDGVAEAAVKGDIALNAVVGNDGLIPTLAAIEAGKDVALSNKETLVSGGAIVMENARKKGVKILPVDSEHSAVFQCLAGGNAPAKIILTASGGPFRNKTAGELAQVTVEDALKHPNWSMGKKVTVDSASLMNKGLEVIEASMLFNMPGEKVQVLVHPQSIIHSMVEFEDGAILAQLGLPDMRLPIQYALTYPKRVKNSFARLNFLKYNSLTFEEPNRELFPCLGLAYHALAAGGLYPAVLNAADEAAVALFLEKKISFLHISLLLERTLEAYTFKEPVTVDNIIAADKWARAYVMSACMGK